MLEGCYCGEVSGVVFCVAVFPIYFSCYLVVGGLEIDVDLYFSVFGYFVELCVKL